MFGAPVEGGRKRGWRITRLAIAMLFIALVGGGATALLSRLVGLEMRRSGEESSCGLVAWRIDSGSWRDHGVLRRFGTAKGSVGLLMSGAEISEGVVESAIRLPRYKNGCKAHLAYDFKARPGHFFTAGLGGAQVAYSLGEVRPETGWRQTLKVASEASLVESEIYRVRVHLKKDKVILEVNDRELVEVKRDPKSPASEVGLWVEGCDAAEFICPRLCPPADGTVK
jgi:hypothetical protein